MDVDADTGADGAGRAHFGGRIDRSDADSDVAHELEESDIERVWSEVGSKVAAIVQGCSNCPWWRCRAAG